MQKSGDSKVVLAVRIESQDHLPLAAVSVSLRSTLDSRTAHQVAEGVTDRRGVAKFEVDRDSEGPLELVIPGIAEPVGRIEPVSSEAAPPAVYQIPYDLWVDEGPGLVASKSLHGESAELAGKPCGCGSDTVLAPAGGQATSAPAGDEDDPRDCCSGGCASTGRGCECRIVAPETRRHHKFEVSEIIGDSSVKTSDGVLVGWATDFEVTYGFIEYRLGQLLNTIPLAPLQTLAVTANEWRENKSASDTNTTSEAEGHDKSVVQDKSIEDALVDTTLRLGLDYSMSLGVGAKLPKLPLTAKVKKSVDSKISFTRHEKETTKQIHGALNQHTSRSLATRTTSVSVSDTSRSSGAETRLVTNPDRCRALTLIYYAMIAKYQTTVRPVGVKPAILLKEQIEFDRTLATAYGYLLKPQLLDPSLAKCFEALKELRCKPKPPPTAYGLVSEITANFRIGKNGTGTGGTATIYFEVAVDGVVHEVAVPRHGSDKRYRETESYTVTWHPSSPVPADKVSTLGLVYEKIGTDKAFDVDNFAATATVDGTDQAVLSASGFKVTKNTPGWSAKPSFTVAKPPPPPLSDEECCEARLLEHLNAHRDYYSQIILSGKNRNAIVRELMDRTIEIDGKQYAAIDVVKPEPLARWGDYVVYESSHDLGLSPPAIDDAPVERSYQYLPTKGVHLEPVLSNCSICDCDDGGITVEEIVALQGVTADVHNEIPEL